MNKKHYILACCLLLLSYIASAQTAAVNFYTITKNAFVDYYQKVGKQEKLYLITDKPYYSAGENIYFSAFLIHPTLFTPAIESSFLYVELISADGRLITRLKVLSDKGRFSNVMPLSTKLDAGRYTLRAYTRWMSNFDKEFLFRKEIEIGNYIDDAIQTHVSYSTNSDKSVVARITFRNSLGRPIANQDMEYTLNLRGKSKAYMSRSNEKGVVTIKFRPSNTLSDCLRVRITANSRILERTFQLPSFSNDFPVQFLPEGGNLIAGMPQIVAFKAIGTDGKSVEVEGYISDNNGNVLCDIKSRHKGMGVFLMTAQADKRYTATITSEKGLTRTFNLPNALVSGCSIQVKHSTGNSILMKVATTPDLPITRLAAVIQTRGVVEAVIEDVSRLKRISLSKMMSGIALISIVDKESKHIVAERLVFVDNQNFATAEITADKSHFSPREKVSLNFRFRNSDGRPTSGKFVVSVTDSEAVQLDPASENIFSYLLLSSDLRGHIEKPAEYFNKENTNRKEYLDLIMLTNGWRRYDLGKILKGDHLKIQHPVEKEQRITGQVMGIIGKARKPSIAIFQKNGRMHGIFPLNATNRFRITGIDSPDTIQYNIQALNRKGNTRTVVIKVDPETYPSTNIPLNRPNFKEYKPSVTEAMLIGAKEKYYTEGGMRVIDIDAVVVTASRENQYSYATAIDSFNSLSGDLTRYASVYDALQRFRQLEIVGVDVRVRKRVKIANNFIEDTDQEITETEEEIPGDEERIPGVLVNGTPADIGVLDMYAMDNITRLAYVEAKDAVGLSANSRFGVIILEVRDVNRTTSTGNRSIANVLVAGYCKPAEFYAPSYDTPSTSNKKDLRTTIAWNPDLRSGKEGMATMSFWTADRRNDYNVVIEGITDEGELCRATYRLIAKQ